MKQFFQKNYFFNPSLLTLFILGVSAGIPFLLTLSTLSFWLCECGVSKTIRGLFMVATLPYTLKVLWSPYLDTRRVPYISQHLGQRRSWIVAAQLLLIISILVLGSMNPYKHILLTFISACMVAFFGATQESAIHAYRIESLSSEDAPLGASMERFGFHFGMFISGVLALYLVEYVGWKLTYWILSLSILGGTLAITTIPRKTEPITIETHATPEPGSYLSHLLKSFSLLMKTFPQRTIFFYLILFVFLFKQIDTAINAMPAFLLPDIGFTKIEYANANKYFGTPLILIGDLVAALLIKKAGALPSLLMTSILQALSSLFFAMLACQEQSLLLLNISIALKSFSSGIAATALVAYLSQFCKAPYTASHFSALWTFSSISRVAISMLYGVLSNYIDWVTLFTFTSLIIIPIFFLGKKLQQAQ